MAKIADLLAAGPTYSFEFFPPKTDEAVRQLDKAVAELAELPPSFVSVTYGALGSTRERTRGVVEELNRQYDFPCMAHLTCVGQTREDLLTLLGAYQVHGVGDVLVLSGDPPADGSPAGGDFQYARELVDLVRSFDHFSIGVACHPEGHPRSTSLESDRRHLAEKLQDADFAITQFFYDAASYFRLLDDLATLGCDKPVLPGVFPFTNVKGLRRMAGINNCTIPAGLDSALDRFGDDPAAIRQLGVETATALGAELLAGDAPGIHLITMNRGDLATEVCRNLGIPPG